MSSGSSLPFSYAIYIGSRWGACRPFPVSVRFCSNGVEGFFARLTNRRLKRRVFHQLVDPQAAINRFLAEHNKSPKPFVLTADPDKIIAAVRRGHQVLDSIHYEVRQRPGKLMPVVAVPKRSAFPKGLGKRDRPLAISWAQMTRVC